MPTGKIKIAPSVLTWARTSLHLTEDDVVVHFAKKSKESFNVDLNFLKNIESNECAIKFNLLQELANLYKRPLSIFLLEAPPKELVLPKDRRTIGSLEHQKLSPETILIFRRVLYTKEIFEDLASDYNYDLKFPYKQVFLDNNPKIIAENFREELGFSFEFQKDKIKNPKDLFDIIRRKLEEVNAFVIKASFPIEDARAFSLVEKSLNIIVINSKDGGYFGYAPKAFSLLHEFAHILLREGGICNDFLNSHIKIEKFCNEFAASFLVPDRILLNVLSDNNLELNDKNIEKSIEILSRIFKVSKQVLLRKCLSNGLINEGFYKNKIAEWYENFEKSEKNKSKFVPLITPGLRAIKNNSNRYVDIVLQAKSQGKITSNNASDYLGVGVKWLSEVEWRVQKS